VGFVYESRGFAAPNRTVHFRISARKESSAYWEGDGSQMRIGHVCDRGHSRMAGHDDGS
jgi:hypothetical protein